MIGMYAPGRNDKKRVGGPFRDLIDHAREESAAEIQPGEENRTFYSLPVWKKLVIMTGGPFMNLLLAIVFFSIVFSGIGVATATTKVGGIVPCVPTNSDLSGEGSATGCLNSEQTPAALSGIQPGERLVRIDETEITEWQDVGTAITAAKTNDVKIIVEDNRGELRTVDVSLANLNIKLLDEEGKPTGEVIERKFFGVSPDIVAFDFSATRNVEDDNSISGRATFIS
jgi:membrane-associated protease RseP (regulator of RpoE activity)